MTTTHEPQLDKPRNLTGKPFRMTLERETTFKRYQERLAEASNARDGGEMHAIHCDESYRDLAAETIREGVDDMASKTSTAYMVRLMAREFLEYKFRSHEALRIAAIRREQMDKRIADLERENISLKLKVAWLEERPVMEYRGVWSPTEAYTRGMLVTLSGSMWIVRAESTKERPGSSSDWQLCVKRVMEER